MSACHQRSNRQRLVLVQLALVLYRHRMARLVLVLLPAPPTAGTTAGAAGAAPPEHKHLIPELILSRVVTSSPNSSRVAGTSSHRPGSPQQQLLLHRVVEAAHRVVQAGAVTANGWHNPGLALGQ